MSYTNEAIERSQLRRLWIEQEDRPCFFCGSRDRREVHRFKNGSEGGEYREDNCCVACYTCHRKQHPNSKFNIGDRVKLNDRTPARIDLKRGRPRTIVAVIYNHQRQCNYYLVGSNARGVFAMDGNPLDGFKSYLFRSYMLTPYEPRRYHLKRPYTRRNGELNTMSSDKRERHQTTRAMPQHLDDPRFSPDGLSASK